MISPDWGVSSRAVTAPMPNPSRVPPVNFRVLVITLTDELQARWESQVQEPKKNGEAQTVVNKPVIKAEEEAERRREQQDKARKEAERHLDKAGKELDKARTKL